MKNTTAIILAAGKGTRMKSDVPKVLHRLGSETILGRVIKNLELAGINDIVVVAGHKAEEVESSFKDKNILFVRQNELKGSGDALRTALDAIDEGSRRILVTCGDAPVITAATYLSITERQAAEGISCCVLTSRVKDPGEYGRITRDASGGITGIVENKDASAEQKKTNEVNVGTYCFKEEDLREFIREIGVNKKKQEFYLTDIVHILSSAGKKVGSESCCEEEMIGVNSRKDLAMANKTINMKALEKLMASGVTIVDPDTTYVDETAVVGKDTVIFPCTVIENDVTVADNCSIGPFARLRPGTRLSARVEIGNFVELCRTEVGEGSKIKHHTYLGDTVVGRNVNVGAGTITANYDGKEKHRTIIEDDVFIGVGVRTVAPVRIGKGAKVGAGCVVTKNKDVLEGQTVVGVPARPLTGKKG